MNLPSNIATIFPNDILLEIFEYLDAQALCKIRTVCKQFLKLAENNRFWSSRFHEKFPNSHLQESADHHYYNLFAAWSGYWKEGSRNDAIVQNNYPNAQNHSQNAVTHLALRGDLIITSNLHATIRVWNWRSQECISVMEGHNDRINCFAMHNDILLSGFQSGHLDRWNWQEPKRLEGFSEETSVDHIVMNARVSILGIDHKDLPIWDYHAKERIGDLKGLRCHPRSLAMQGNTVAGGDICGTVCVWNCHTQECLATLKDDLWNSVSCLAIQESGLLVFGCTDKTIRVWNWKTAQSLFEMNKHQEAPTSLALQGDIVISSSCNENAPLVWNWRTQEHLACLDVDQKDVRSLALQGDTLACCAVVGSIEDKGLVVWKTHHPENTEHLYKSRRLT